MNAATYDFRSRDPLSVKGRFYVDGQCLDCDLCRELLPSVFKRYDPEGVSYVHSQPSTPEEIARTEEVLTMCCVEAIRNDGDSFDWGAHPPLKRYGELTPEEKEQRHELEKSTREV